MKADNEELPTRRSSAKAGQFSTRTIIATTIALAILLAVYRLDPDATPLGFLIFFLASLWGALLVSVAIGLSHWWIGALGGTACAACLFVAVWRGMLSEQQMESTGAGIVVATTILALDLWALWRGRWHRVPATTVTDSPEDRTRLQRAAAAWYSLIAMGGLVILLLVPFKYNDALIVIVAWLLLFLMLLPWLVVWRRRQMAGLVYPEGRIDQLAQRLLRYAAPLAIGSFPLSLLILAIPSSHTGSGWEVFKYLGYIVLIVGGVIIFHLVGLLMFVTSLAIQWYRDRWLPRGNLLTFGYALLCLTGFLVLSYFNHW